ncbi:MAG: hypothetical protein F4X19_15555 [Acidobacteria bacterium]|nr:hypothetical protein [Acidobacteriota bacterium]
MKYAWRMAAALLVLFGGCTATEEPSRTPAGERRIIYNSDTGNAFAEFWGSGAPLSEMDAEAVRKVVARGVDELARAGVDTLSMVVSHRFHSLYGPSEVLEEHWRQVDKGGGYRSLREAGVDFRQLMAELSHRSGMEFLGCIRMNDRHGGPVGRFIEENPQWHLKLPRGPAIDFAPEPVRQKMLDYIEELVAAVDLDGLELDYMRWCHMFPPGQGAGNAHLLTDFMRKTRTLLEAAAERKGRGPLVLGVRVPQTLAECEYLGFDLAAWIKQGLVDFVVPSDFFYTDLNTRVEDFVKLAEGTDCRIYPAIHPITYRSDDVGINDLSHYRAAARNFYAYGASGVEAYNYQYHWGRRIGRNTPWPAYLWPAALGYLDHLKDPEDIGRHDRHYRYYPLWEEGAPTETGPKDDRIRLDRAVAEPSGSQQFRLAEDLSDKRLRATLQFKAVGLAADESLEIALNGNPVPNPQITRHFDQDGQNRWEGKVLPAFHLYVLDLDGGSPQPLLVHGDNRLEVRLTGNRSRTKGEVTLEELEVYVYRRGK